MAEAFGASGEEVAGVVDALDASGHVRASLVAEVGGEVVGHVQLNRSWYAARGFVRASELGFERPSVRIPDPAFQVVAFDSREPWMTGRLVYCVPFWALDCVGLRDPLLAELEG